MELEHGDLGHQDIQHQDILADNYNFPRICYGIERWPRSCETGFTVPERTNQLDFTSLTYFFRTLAV
jgi:hypothetical protein